MMSRSGIQTSGQPARLALTQPHSDPVPRRQMRDDEPSHVPGHRYVRQRRIIEAVRPAGAGLGLTLAPPMQPEFGEPAAVVDWGPYEPAIRQWEGLLGLFYRGEMSDS